MLRVRERYTCYAFVSNTYVTRWDIDVTECAMGWIRLVGSFKL